MQNIYNSTYRVSQLLFYGFTIMKKITNRREYFVLQPRKLVRVVEYMCIYKCITRMTNLRLASNY